MPMMAPLFWRNEEPELVDASGLELGELSSVTKFALALVDVCVSVPGRLDPISAGGAVGDELALVVPEGTTEDPLMTGDPEVSLVDPELGDETKFEGVFEGVVGAEVSLEFVASVAGVAPFACPFAGFLSGVEEDEGCAWGVLFVGVLSGVWVAFAAGGLVADCADDVS
jgi:hypothetical protein